MANLAKLDMSGMTELLTEIDALGGSAKRAAELALKKAAVSVQNDTIVAVQKSNLPAGGHYSTGDTQRSIIHFPKVEWEGETAWVPIGFDFAKPGAGGFLIKGTPRMKPDAALKKMYQGKKYMNAVQKLMWDELMTELEKLWASKKS